MANFIIAGVVANPDNWDGLVADGLARWRADREAGRPVNVRARVSEPVKLRSGFSIDYEERWIINDKSKIIDKISEWAGGEL